MRLLLFIFLSAVITIGLTVGSYIFFDNYTHNRPLFQFSQISSLGQIGSSPTPMPVEKPLEKYEILQLSTRVSTPSAIVFDEAIATTASFTKYTFHYMTGGKKATGLATLPHGITPSDSSNPSSSSTTSKSPVIIQFRGYVDKSIYAPGIGTSRSAEVFAEKGFVSLAPDFLGYGGSDMPANDIFEERFQTYTTALDLIASIGTVPFVDPDQVGLWGHSNGGHIALTVLEILNKPIPLTLWAPVTKYFPYSILYFTDEAEDGGKALRKELAKFEEKYDVNKFTLTTYEDRLIGPIQFHQGTADDAVPKVWSDVFVDSLKKLDKDITYYVYPGADHNMQGSWNTVVERDIQFFTKELLHK